MDESKQIENTVKRLIAQMVGVEVEDVQNSDSLRDDYQMSPVDLTDLAENLYETNVVSKEIDMVEINTVEDLLVECGAEVV